MASGKKSRFDPDPELSELFTRLWTLDENKCYPGTDYAIDLQGYVNNTRSVGRDRASDKLFLWVEEDSVFEKPTYKTFLALLDNYCMDLGTAEQVTRQERFENHRFIDAIMETSVMQDAHRFLVENGKAPEDEFQFKKLLDRLWFKLIRRTKGDRDFDSSSFEHVFVGECRGVDVIGFHNWIQFYRQERDGHIDYKGFFRRETIADDEVPRLIAVQFGWKGISGKPMCSVFLGSSPEFEIAVFTVCSLMDKTGNNDVQLDEYEVEITCYNMGPAIGTAFISAARM